MDETDRPAFGAAQSATSILQVTRFLELAAEFWQVSIAGPLCSFLASDVPFLCWGRSNFGGGV